MTEILAILQAVPFELRQGRTTNQIVNFKDYLEAQKKLEDTRKAGVEKDLRLRLSKAHAELKAEKKAGRQDPGEQLKDARAALLPAPVRLMPVAADYTLAAGKGITPETDEYRETLKTLETMYSRAMKAAFLQRVSTQGQELMNKLLRGQ